MWGAVDSNTATTVASQTAAVLRAHPEITVVFAPYDEFARGVKLGASEAGVADKIKVYSADVSTADIQEIREPGSPWVATSATNPAVVGEVSLRALALLIAGQDPGKVIEVKPRPDHARRAREERHQDRPGPRQETAGLRRQRSGDRALARRARTDAVTLQTWLGGIRVRRALRFST